MTELDTLDQQRRIERHRTVRAALWVVALLIIAAMLFGIYRVVTAPVRAAQNTTASVTESVGETATAVLTVRHVEVASGRRFARLADAAHRVLNALPARAPATLSERAFRAANLRGSRDQVCTFAMDFGAGPVTVHAAADNDAFATDRVMGGDGGRQVRLVFVSDEGALGLNAEYDDSPDGQGWTLLWRRRNAARKPLSDAVASARALDALARVADECSPSAP